MFVCVHSGCIRKKSCERVVKGKHDSESLRRLATKFIIQGNIFIFIFHFFFRPSWKVFPFDILPVVSHTFPDTLAAAVAALDLEGIPIIRLKWICISLYV